MIDISEALVGTLERVLVAHPATKDLPKVALVSLITELASELTNAKKDTI